MRWQSFIYSCDYSQDTATQPGRFSGPLHPFPIWSYSEWGLPSQVITYLLVRSYRTVPPLPDKSGGTLFCGTIPKVSLAGRYPAFRPMELGLSSPPAFLANTGAAIAFHTHTCILPYMPENASEILMNLQILLRNQKAYLRTICDAP